MRNGGSLSTFTFLPKISSQHKLLPGNWSLVVELRFMKERIACMLFVTISILGPFYIMNSKHVKLRM